ncbi:MAG: RadC family protein [Oscillospiraceae bacterium]|nr:RadC family protein [Oscillospiraceae bacterium]
MDNKGKDLSEKKNPHEGHRKRMRQRFIETGLNGFSDHQVLEMLLFYSCPRRDTNLMAHALIERFGDLAGVLNADLNALTQVQGISESSAVLLKLITETAAVYFRNAPVGMVYDSTEKLMDYYRPLFIGKDNEEFVITAFNNDIRIIATKTLFTGSPSSADVGMREIARFVLETNAAMAAISHNHPNTSAAPSDDDIAVTRRINVMLKELDVYLLDHIIIGRGSSFSMRNNGTISVFD